MRSVNKGYSCKFRFKWGTYKIVAFRSENHTVDMFCFSCKQVMYAMVAGLNFFLKKDLHKLCDLEKDD